MARDLEIFEADSQDALKILVKDYIKNSGVRILNIEYHTYTDFETEELVYSASIFIEHRSAVALS